ncbi:HD-GYP domain-containing protein [Rubrivivax sp. JA1026]|uniref:HD-GYP domain-containing protein n=1 Tax=Rubrivivax sp. JA1026 TaxID=2710888 RepID=UPI0013E91983|nr:HD-GYP domain-containing protein [Rubrivivax sp. JA1026]
MLKKISVSDLRLGMHLHGFEGSWMDHPFWRTRFVIDDPKTLAQAHQSGVRECWIDTSLGLDVAPAGVDVRPRPPAPPPPPVAAAVPSPAPPPPRPPTTTMAEELQAAAAVCKRGREAVVSMFSDARLGRAIDGEACMPLVEEVTESVFRNPGALVSLARLKTHDDYTYMHSVAVCALMVALGRQLGADDTECRRLGLAGLLHDIGKALMPSDVLNKPGKLTDREFDVMRSHPERGHHLLQEARGAGSDALEVCLHHHERVDGTGYPHKLSGDALTREARMGAVCDVYDAITSNRPYKAGWDPAESIARMVSWKGHFDEAILAAFVRSVGIYPTGSLVRMESGRIGIVVEQNPGKPAAPVLSLFYSTRAAMPIPPLRLDLAQAASDRIVGREPAQNWAGRSLDELWLPPEAARARR